MTLPSAYLKYSTFRVCVLVCACVLVYVCVLVYYVYMSITCSPQERAISTPLYKNVYISHSEPCEYTQVLNPPSLLASALHYMKDSLLPTL